MTRAPHLRDSLVTTGHLASMRHGLRVHCACGHHGQLSPSLIAQAPCKQIFDYKCRLRCSQCGQAGSADQVEVRVYLEVAPFAIAVRAHTRGTPPQLVHR